MAMRDMIRMANPRAALRVAVLAAGVCTSFAALADQETLSKITGVTWRAATVGQQPVDPTLTVDMTIAKDGATSGHSGCNRYVTKAKIEGNSITFEPAGGTRMMCDEAKMKLEHQFFSALEQVRTFDAETAGTLSFYDQNGNDVAIFTSD